MLQLRVYGDVTTLDTFGAWLEDSGRGQHTVLAPARHAVHNGLLTADVDGEAAQDVLARLDTVGVRPRDIELVRVESIGPARPGGVNVAMLLVGGTVTLAVRRWLYRREWAANPARREVR